MPHPFATRRAAMLGAAALIGSHAPRAMATEPRLEQFDLRAADGTAHRIFVAQPAEPAPPAGWPVLTILDGNAIFPMALQALRERAVPPVALVGIGYPTEDSAEVVARRFHDLTDQVPPEFERLADGTLRRTGGRDAYRAFLLETVRPAIAARLPVDAQRQALFGHSLGGLLALYLLFTRPAAFRTVVAADPSIWWNDRSILREQAAFLAQRPARPAPPVDLLIETSGLRERPPGAPPRTPSGPMAMMLRPGPNGREVAEALTGAPGLGVTFRTFPEEGHGSMRSPAIGDALSFLFGQALRGQEEPPR